MKRCILFFVISLFSIGLKAGVGYTGDETSVNQGRDTVLKFSLGGGAAFSTVNMRIEPIGQIKSGWNARASLRFLKRMAVCAEYTSQGVHAADPAWINIHAHNLDLNLTYLYFNVGTSLTSFYAISGVCMQQWNAEYKGPAAVEGDNYNYKSGDLKTFNWTSLNAGLGFERNYNHLGLFGEFKFRFGQNNSSDPIGIVDVVATFGAKIDLHLHHKKSTGEPEPKTPGRKKFSIAPKIYHWF